MRSREIVALSYGISLLLGGLATGCSRDPNVQKQRFFEQGNRDFDKGRYAEANISYSRALQIDPRFAEAHYKRAQCLLRQNASAAAFLELSQAVDLRPDNWVAQLNLGQLYFTGGKYQEARDHALLILRGNPKHEDAAMLLSEADAALGKLKDAVEEAKAATEMAPDRSAVFINLGLIEFRAEALGEAEKSLKKAQSLDSASITPVLSLGTFYQRQKRWSDAEVQFRAAISLDSKSIVARGALAGLYMAEGQDLLVEKVLSDVKQDFHEQPAAYRMLGDYYLTRRDGHKALAEFGILSAEHQSDLAVRKTYIQLLILNRRIDEASKLNDWIMEKTPQDGEALILKGQIELQQKKVDEGIHSLQQAIQQLPDNALGHYYLGVAFQQKGWYQQAEREWRDAVHLLPSFSEAWSALGNNALKHGDWRGLESVADQLERIMPRSPDGYLFHATARMNQGDTRAAEVDLNQLILISPMSALGYVKIGQLRVAQKRLAEAEKMYRQGLARDPNSLEALHGLVDVYFRNEKSADAFRVIQARLDRDPTNASLFLLKGEALLRNKQPEEAEDFVERAVEMDGQNLSALVLLAQLESSRGKFDQSIRNYQRAIRLAPNSVQLYAALGSVLETQGNWPQAQSAYQRILSLQPEDSLAANNLACILLDHGGNVAVALTLAQTARRGLPNLPNTADTLGWAYYHNAAYSLAAPLLEEAVEGRPSNGTYRYHLGITYEQLNDARRARAELEKSIRMDPKGPSAEKASRALNKLSGS
jgi:tetratricopeptide (TPR) repeat protein